MVIESTDIPELRVIDLVLHADGRGWFKENWQREKMAALGLSDFRPVQHNIAHNGPAGVIRGVHAEPWDKLVSVANGSVFGAWVDLRQGSGFGRLVTRRISPGQAVFVPRGVGNAYQTLEPGTAYTYLVNAHWSPTARRSYVFLDPADPQVGIPWPIALARSTLADADRDHPALADITPMAPRRTILIGADGQLGRALRRALPGAEPWPRERFDLAGTETFDTADVGVIINAGAYTAVDAAERDRAAAWATNVTGVRRLVAAARECGAVLVQVSSDYVFDGTRAVHDEDEPLSPLGFYGVTKAAADEVVATWERHYIVRTSWLVGEGPNFVTTMARLADRGESPAVVNDQFGRLTAADTLAAGIRHLLESRAEYGTYNLTNSGPVRTWADIAADIYSSRGKARDLVRPVSTQAYAAGRPVAERPARSTLSLAKIEATGFSVPPPPTGTGHPAQIDRDLV